MVERTTGCLSRIGQCQRKICCEQKCSHNQENRSRLHCRRISLLDLCGTGKLRSRPINARRECWWASNSFILMTSFLDSLFFLLHAQEDIPVAECRIKRSTANTTNAKIISVTSMNDRLHSYLVETTRHEMIWVNETQMVSWWKDSSWRAELFILDDGTENGIISKNNCLWRREKFPFQISSVSLRPVGGWRKFLINWGRLSLLIEIWHENSSVTMKSAR